MRCRNTFWFVIFVFAIALIAAAPSTGLCDEWTVDQLDLGATPVDPLPGLHQGLAARYGNLWNTGERPPLGLAFAKKLSDNFYEISFGFVFNGKYTDLGLQDSSAAMACPNPTHVTMGLAQMPGSDTQAVMNVAALCDGQLSISQGIVDGVLAGDDDIKFGVNWWLADPEPGERDPNSISADSILAGDTLYQTVCGADGDSVYCWDPGVGRGGPAERQQYTAPSGPFFTSNLNHSYDDQGRIHMIGTDSDGRLGYALFPAGSTQADAGSIYWVGDASINQAWDWTQVKVAPDGMVWISAFNTKEGSIYVWNKEADSANHWYFIAVKTPDGPLGKYNSMAVESRSGNAVMLFSNERGHAVVMTVDKARQIMTRTFDAAHGQPYSTGIDAGAGIADGLWFGGDINDPRVVRLGAKIDF